MLIRSNKNGSITGQGLLNQIVWCFFFEVFEKHSAGKVNAKLDDDSAILRHSFCYILNRCAQGKSNHMEYFLRTVN